MGKTYVDSRGFLRFRDTDKLVHRWVAEKMLGRPMHEGEHVHHKNGDKDDNSPCNLRITAWDEHKKEHVINDVHGNKECHDLKDYPELASLSELDLCDLGIKKAHNHHKE